MASDEHRVMIPLRRYYQQDGSRTAFFYEKVADAEWDDGTRAEVRAGLGGQLIIRFPDDPPVTVYVLEAQDLAHAAKVLRMFSRI